MVSATHPKDGLPILAFPDGAAFEDWLATNVDSGGVWIKVAKKGSGIASVTHVEALDVALCYGWIDGQRLPLDEQYFLQRFTPRRARSNWSKINVDKVAALEAAGRMQPRGRAEVDRAKADGRWDAAYAGQRTATVPPDLQEALDANPDAKTFFATLSSVNRYAIIYRVGDAKRPETRARRIAKFVEMCARGETVH